MGKIRVKAVGDEEQEKQQLAEAKVRKEAKKLEKQASASEDAVTSTDAEVEKALVEKKAKKEKFQDSKGPARSKSYMAKVELLDKNKHYTLDEAIKLLPELKRAKFDETVEIHFTTTETGIAGSVTLPHGTGKQLRIALAHGSDQKEIDDLLQKIEKGTIDFDILIATPDAMPKLARAAKILGPRGLMPNPKNGTVNPNPEEVAKKYEGGQINFKTEAKFPLLHVAIGKVSFGDVKIKDNAKTVFDAIDKKKIKNATLKSTMSPAIHLDLASI